MRDSELDIARTIATLHKRSLPQIPFEHRKPLLRLADLRAAVGELPPMGRRPIGADFLSVGIDWGETETWLIALAAESRINVNYAISFWACVNDGSSKIHLEKCSRIVRDLEPDIVVNDSNGIGWGPDEVLRQSVRPIRVLGGRFDSTEQTGNRLAKPRLETRSRVIIPKYRTAMWYRDLLSTGSLRLPKDPEGLQAEFAKHHTHLFAVEKRGKKGTSMQVQTRPDRKPDHLFTAVLFALAGVHVMQSQRPRAA